MEKRRETELDLLRILALLAVISVHCTGMGNDKQSITGYSSSILVFFDSIVTWQVPIYVMISGRFFLDPERDMSFKKILKSIGRLMGAFLIWDVIYQGYYILSGAYNGMNWKGILSQAVVGPYHFWFLYMLVCMYAITPFLRKIAEERYLMKYFILLFLLFEFLTYYGVGLPVVGSTIEEVLVKTNFHFALGYSGYYILGCYLHKYEVSDRLEILLYGIAVIFLIIASAATVRRAGIEGVNGEWYTKYLMPNVAVEAAAIYIFFTKRVGKYHFSGKAIRWISKLSEYSFGVYLIHALVAEIMGNIGISPVIANPFIMLPIIVLFVFIISNILVWGLRSIPYVGKRIT